MDNQPFIKKITKEERDSYLNDDVRYTVRTLDRSNVYPKIKIAAWKAPIKRFKGKEQMVCFL